MIFIPKTIHFSKPIHEREGTKHGETRSNHPANTATRASAAKMDKNTPKPLHNTHNHHSFAEHRRSQHSQSLRSPIEALRNLTRNPLQSRNQPDRGSHQSCRTLQEQSQSHKTSRNDYPRKIQRHTPTHTIAPNRRSKKNTHEFPRSRTQNRRRSPPILSEPTHNPSGYPRKPRRKKTRSSPRKRRLRNSPSKPSIAIQTKRIPQRTSTVDCPRTTILQGSTSTLRHLPH